VKIWTWDESHLHRRQEAAAAVQEVLLELPTTPSLKKTFPRGARKRKERYERKEREKEV